MTSGKLRHKLDFEREIETVDSVGGLSSVWVNDQTLMGLITPLRGNELLHAMQVKSKVTHKITLRYNPSVIPKDRIIYNNREFRISSIINIEERSEWLEIKVTEGSVN